jgi:hypothetical protein
VRSARRSQDGTEPELIWSSRLRKMP